MPMRDIPKHPEDATALSHAKTMDTTPAHPERGTSLARGRRFRAPRVLDTVKHMFEVG